MKGQLLALTILSGFLNDGNLNLHEKVIFIISIFIISIVSIGSHNCTEMHICYMLVSCVFVLFVRYLR